MNFKKTILLLTILLFGYANACLAYPCDDDASDMYHYIDQSTNKYITTVDGQHNFDLILNQYQKNKTTCTALVERSITGPHDPVFVCYIQWKIGAWKSSVNCV